jgi:hypothetical protein
MGDLLNLDGVENLPAIEWKLHSLRRMEKKRPQKAVEK